MFNNFHYAYIFGCLFFSVIWICLFSLRKDLRKEMLIMSILVAPLGPLSELFYRRDYWQPQLFDGRTIGLEDLWWSFLIGGITAVVYEEFFGKKYLKRHLKKHSHWMLGMAALFILWMIVGNRIFGFNSIYVSSLGFLIIGFVSLLSRHDLIKDAFFSGFFISILMFLMYFTLTPLFPGVIQKWWMLKNISGVVIFGAPLEEIMWGFCWGFMAGPLYEFIRGLEFSRKRITN